MRDAQTKRSMPARSIDSFFGQAGMALDCRATETARGVHASVPTTDIVAAIWPRFSPWVASIEAAPGIVPADDAAPGNRLRAN